MAWHERSWRPLFLPEEPKVFRKFFWCIPRWWIVLSDAIEWKIVTGCTSRFSYSSLDLSLLNYHRWNRARLSGDSISLTSRCWSFPTIVRVLAFKMYLTVRFLSGTPHSRNKLWKGSFRLFHLLNEMTVSVLHSLVSFSRWPMMSCNIFDRTNFSFRRGLSSSETAYFSSNFVSSANKAMDNMRQPDAQSSSDEEDRVRFPTLRRNSLLHPFSDRAVVRRRCRWRRVEEGGR